eukprot:3654308-Pyramimonas_sp.AAC.1
MSQRRPATAAAAASRAAAARAAVTASSSSATSSDPRSGTSLLPNSGSGDGMASATDAASRAASTR